MNAGDPQKMVSYNRKALHNLTEPRNSIIRTTALQILNQKSRLPPYRERKSFIRKGLNVPDIDRIYLDFSKYFTENSQKSESDESSQKHRL